MLPTVTDNGGRLAAILPTGLLALAKGLDRDLSEVFQDALGLPESESISAGLEVIAELVPPIRSLVIIAVDGLGTANLKARAGHAQTLASLPMRRITTVAPTTTSAALTTLTTGRLPAEHGLIGYQIMHPEFGLLSSLRDWDHIDNVRDWQHAEPLFGLAAALGASPYAFGRPAHAGSGFTRAILTGAEVVPGEKIQDRMMAARRQLETGEPTLAYVYVDELDRAGHGYGWQSDQWTRRLEQLDEAIADFLTGLPADVGVVLTADHGMVDVQRTQHVVFDLTDPLFADVEAFGGEPRFRSFYLRSGADPHDFSKTLADLEGKRAWIATRDELFASGVFGTNITPGVVERVGDVVLAARGQVAYYCTTDDPQSFDMVGQHGSLTDEEQGIPLVLGGKFAGSGFARAVETLAKLIG